jgi:hypothetical protein
MGTLYPDGRGQFFLTLDQQVDRTLWYGLEVFPATVNVDPLTEEDPVIRVFPNPVADRVWVEVETGHFTGSIQSQVFNLTGQPVSGVEERNASSGVLRWSFPMAHLPAGVYGLRVRTGSQVIWRTIVRH